ncbi:AAA family ATPase [Schaalia meyeri]|uniref:AAA family ATPase n=1 Tax=Schaalia meyeri TaxID=52773 RepID=UPI0009E28921|nr:AAA family ATPase [Schaalia meyeri]
MITEVDLSEVPCFASGAKLTKLNKVNFVFGPNGTGKTSITRILSAGPDDSRITRDAEPSNREILILNSDYIENTFQDTVDGIFFLGKQSIANENEIQDNKRLEEQLKEQIDSLEHDIKVLKSTQSDAKKKVLRAIWSSRDSVPTQLSSCLQGFNGSKKKLFAKLNETRQQSLHSINTHVTTLAELAAEEKGILTSTLETVTRVSTAPQLPLELKDLPDLLRTPLIPAADSPLSDLISQVQNSDWVRDGKEIMEKHLDALRDRCPFCQQKTPPHFGESLTKLWDRSYDAAVARLHSYLAALDSSIKQVSTFKGEIDKHQLEDVSENANSPLVVFIQESLAEAHRHLKTKLEKHSQSIEAPEQWDIDNFNTELRKLTGQLNALIDEHNSKVNDQDRLQREFKERFWSIYAHHTCDSAFETFESIVEGENGTSAQITTLTAQLSSITKQLEETTERINAAERGRMDVHSAIKHINRALSGIGITSFELGATTDDFNSTHPAEINKRDAYVLLRRNENGRQERADVKRLSDGERNLICFLYFFHQFHEDTANTNKKFTVVIDDPINAMDGLSSFITSGFIRELIRSILQLKKTPEHKFVDQLIILTHSTRFHIETSYELPTDGRKAKQCAFYEIRRTRSTTDPGTSTKSTIDEPTHTTTIENEYSQLWKQIRNAHDSLTKATHTDHTETLFIGNAMRRIIEAYFIHLGNCDSISELGRSPDPATRALMAFCNNNSHDALDMDLHTICNIPFDQLFSAFRGIFASNHAEDHYCMMMRKGSPTGADV